MTECNGQGVSRYVLVTPAYNEEAHIETTIHSVISQTVLPVKWIIVDDASTDRTGEIVRRYADEWQFIELQRVEARQGHGFASKVFAFDRGVDRLRQTDFSFIGNLDGDVSFGETYFEQLLERFGSDPRLGIAGGSIYEWDGGRYSPRRGNTSTDVAGAVEMFRRECYEEIGGLLPLAWGGEDWCAQVTARMGRWHVRSFSDLGVRHHRPIRDALGSCRRAYRQGRMDYSLGCHPVLEVFRVVRRACWRPPILGGTARLWGFLRGYCCSEQRLVSTDFVRFLRHEELSRLHQAVSTMLPGSLASLKRRAGGGEPLLSDGGKRED